MKSKEIEMDFLKRVFIIIDEKEFWDRVDLKVRLLELMKIDK